MNIQTADVSSTRKNVTVSLAAAQVSEQEKGIVKQISSQAKLPGFRPGKAPEAMVRQRFAKEIREELSRKVVSMAYDKTVKDSGLKVYGIVNIDAKDIEGSKDATVTLTVDLVPEFDVPEYKGIEIHKHPEAVTEEEIVETLDRIRGQRAEFNPVERAANKGDYVKLSYEGKIDGKLIKEIVPAATMYGSQPVTWEEAGSEEAPGVQAIVQALVGLKTGDKKTVEQVFAADFEVPELAGKTAQYDIEVLEVRERVLPVLDEAFLKSLNFESLDALRDRVKTEVEMRKKQDNSQHMRQQIINALVDKVSFDVPESAIDRETAQVMNHHMSQIMQRGVSREQFMEQQKEIQEGARKSALRNIRAEFILSRIAEKEAVKVEEKDLQERILQEAYMRRQSPDQLVKELSKDRGRIGEIHRAAVFNKTLELLVQTAKVEVKEECGCGHDH